jgi:hypothetical protein
MKSFQAMGISPEWQISTSRSPFCHALSPFQMPPLLFKPAGLVHPEELQDHHDYHDDADDIKDAVHTFSPAIDVLNIDFFNFL